MEQKRVFAVLDRIAHPGTSDLDREQSLAALQRLLKGKLPSDLLPWGTAAKADSHDHRSYDGWQSEIADLKQKLAEVEAEKTTSEKRKQRELRSLIIEIAKLQAKLDRHTAPPKLQQAYTYAEVIQVMVGKFGKHHGVQAALYEHNRKIIHIDPTLPKITEAQWHVWRKRDDYPPYVIEQINTMSKDDLLPRHSWTDADREFLAALYCQSSQQTDQDLATACSRQFGRIVNVRSIKGELHRLRKQQRITSFRRLN